MLYLVNAVCNLQCFISMLLSQPGQSLKSIDPRQTLPPCRIISLMSSLPLLVGRWFLPKSCYWTESTDTISGQHDNQVAVNSRHAPCTTLPEPFSHSLYSWSRYFLSCTAESLICGEEQLHDAWNAYRYHTDCRQLCWWRGWLQLIALLATLSVTLCIVWLCFERRSARRTEDTWLDGYIDRSICGREAST